MRGVPGEGLFQARRPDRGTTTWQPWVGPVQSEGPGPTFEMVWMFSRTKDPLWHLIEAWVPATVSEEQWSSYVSASSPG